MYWSKDVHILLASRPLRFLWHMRSSQSQPAWCSACVQSRAFGWVWTDAEMSRASHRTAATDGRLLPTAPCRGSRVNRCCVLPTVPESQGCCLHTPVGDRPVPLVLRRALLQLGHVPGPARTEALQPLLLVRRALAVAAAGPAEQRERADPQPENKGFSRHRCREASVTTTQPIHSVIRMLCGEAHNFD